MTPTNLSEAVAAEIRVEMARANMSGAELARRINVPASWVQRRTAGATPLTLDDFVALADAVRTRSSHPEMILARAMAAYSQAPAVAR